MNRNPLRFAEAAALTAALVLVLAACGGTDDSASDSSATDAGASTAAASSPADTTDGVNSAQWGDNVEITMGEDAFQFESNGIPDHEVDDQYLVPQGDFTPPVEESEVTATDSSESITETPLDISIPLKPEYSETVTETNLGMIGVVISGAQQFNDYEDPDRSFVAVDDNFAVGGVSFVDGCNGHPLATNVGGGNYHYHGVPYCITDAIDNADEHSHILGFLLDGFPVYGPQDENGEPVDRADLDECNGQFGPTPEFPDGIYHYHVMEDQSPYTPDCYHGVVETTNGAGRPAEGGGPGGPPDFSEAAEKLGVTEEELIAALGQPPFDLAAAAEKLGVTEAELEAALPAPPDGAGD
ncbi:MAG: YHYH protein [Nocardioides sp.]